MSANAKSASSPAAKGLNHWRKELLKVSLPALSDTGAHLLKALKNPDISLMALERIIAEDPVLSFQILARASKQRHSPENDILSLPQALSLLGMDKLRPMLSKVKYLRFDPAKKAHNAFLQALNTSLHAATQAWQLAERKQPGSGEGHYWISLRLSSVYWMLALASPKTYHLIEQRVQTGESRHRVEKELMGCTTQQLTQALLPQWGLSPQTQTNLTRVLAARPRLLAETAACAWQKELAPETPRHIGLFLQTPWMASVLAHWLALNTAVNWLTPKTWRIERMISAYLHQPLHEVIPFLHRNAVISSKKHPLPGVWLPAIRLLHPALPKRSIVIHRKKTPESRKDKHYKDLSSDTRKRAELKPVRDTQASRIRLPESPAHSAKPVTEKPAATARISDKTAHQTALFRLFYLQTVKEKQVSSVHQMMDGASQVLHFDLGLTRCILFMKSRNQGAVTGVYAKGFQDNRPFGSMKLEADSAHLFGKLLKKQVALWAKPEHLSRYVAELPDGFWPHLDTPGEFVLSSIMLRGKVSGILYADNKGSGRPLEASHYATFRAVAQAISQGMDTLASRKEREHRQKS